MFWLRNKNIKNMYSTKDVVDINRQKAGLAKSSMLKTNSTFSNNEILCTSEEDITKQNL